MILSDLVPNHYQGAHIFGSEGMISITTETLDILNAKSGGRWERHVPGGKFYTVEELGNRFEWQEGAAGQADELADWVEGEVDAHRGQGEHGYKALQMIHAVYESARMHERVEMPLQTRVNPLDLMVDSGHLTPQRPGKYDIRALRLRRENMQEDTLNQ